VAGSGAAGTGEGRGAAGEGWEAAAAVEEGSE